MRGLGKFRSSDSGVGILGVGLRVSGFRILGSDSGSKILGFLWV